MENKPKRDPFEEGLDMGVRKEYRDNPKNRRKSRDSWRARGVPEDIILLSEGIDKPVKTKKAIADERIARVNKAIEQSRGAANKRLKMTK